MRIDAADARDPDLGVFARMAVATGARRGELAALRWTDIDLAGGLVHIRGAVVSDDETGTGIRRSGRVTTKDTKTHAERTVAIDASTAQTVRSMRSRHVQDALACGVAYPVDAYLFRETSKGRNRDHRTALATTGSRSTRQSTTARMCGCTICVTSTARCSSVQACRCPQCATASVTRA